MKSESRLPVTENKLKRLVSLMVDRKIHLLKEGKKFQAIRSLTIQAQQTAMKFEEAMIDSLELKEPDDLCDEEQTVYAQAMEDMHAKIIEAVVHAAEVLKNLSSRPEEDSGKKSSSKSSSSLATDKTVEKPLPTL
jgi:chemotaxis response regulator CheB